MLLNQKRRAVLSLRAALKTLPRLEQKNNNALDVLLLINVPLLNRETLTLLSKIWNNYNYSRIKDTLLSTYCPMNNENDVLLLMSGAALEWKNTLLLTTLFVTLMLL